MTTHAALGMPMDMLDVIVIDDSKPMQTIIRSILASFAVGRIRTFDSAVNALQAMLTEPPNLIITDYRMSPMNGYQLLRSIRNRNMAPLCYVPVIMVTAHSTRTIVEKSYRGGANAVLVKPLSPMVLQKRLEWVVRDARPFDIDESGHCVVAGVEESLTANDERFSALSQAREYHDLMTRQVMKKQDTVDRIIDDEPEIAVAEPQDIPAKDEQEAAPPPEAREVILTPPKAIKGMGGVAPGRAATPDPDKSEPEDPDAPDAEGDAGDAGGPEIEAAPGAEADTESEPDDPLGEEELDDPQHQHQMVAAKLLGGFALVRGEGKPAGGKSATG